MAITRIGSLVEIQIVFDFQLPSGSQSITVPGDAEIIVVALGGYGGIANYYTAGSVSIGGTPCSLEVAQGNASTSYFQCALFALDVRALTGTQTLAWSFSGAEQSGSHRLVYGFYKGVDTTAPFLDSDGAQMSAISYTTPTLTAESGALIVAWANGYSGTTAGTPTWSGGSAIESYLTPFGTGVGSWAEGSPSGDTTVAVTAWSNAEDGGICAIVLNPAAAANVSRDPAQGPVVFTGYGMPLKFAILMPDEP